MLALAPACTLIQGPCAREVTVAMKCDVGGTAVVFPGEH